MPTHPTENEDLPDQHDHADAEACEALAELDLRPEVVDALAAAAEWEARCEAFAWSMAVRLAGGDAWVCARLALAGLMDGTDPADLRGEV